MTESPTNNFYSYVNQKWLKLTKIPKSYSRWSIFEELHEKNLKIIENIITHSENNKIKILKNQFNKKKTYQNIFINNLSSYISSKDKLVSIIGKLNQYNIGNILNIYVTPDYKNSNYNILGVFPSLLLLPDKDFYTNDKYYYELKILVDNIFKHLHIKQDFKELYSIQKKISKIIMNKEDLRNPEKTYNVYSFQKFKQTFNNFNWDLFFKSCNITKMKEIIVADINELKQFIIIFNKYSFKTLKHFLLLQLTLSTSHFLDDELDNIIFNFYGKIISGIQTRKSKKKRMIEFLSSQLGEIISHEYIQTHFSSSSKDFMITIVQNLIHSYKNRILNLKWMNNKTKQKALLKLSKMKYKIGYPDTFKQYDNLLLDSKNSLFYNVMLINKFEYEYDISFLYKKPDTKTWSMMPYEINAYYNPLKNEIVFPAGILQKPFFDLSLSLPQIYGGIGSIIGHEITHGFDDQGKKFDHNGNLQNWWTTKDDLLYNQKTQKIIKQFNHFSINNKNVNGTLTQGENIADLGGLLISLDAFKKHKPNFTDNDIKIFFESWARIWRYKINDKRLEKNLLTDVHSPNNFRVNGPIVHIDDFHKVYKTSPGDKMFLEKNKRIQIW